MTNLAALLKGNVRNMDQRVVGILVELARIQRQGQMMGVPEDEWFTISCAHFNSAIDPAALSAQVLEGYMRSIANSQYYDHVPTVVFEICNQPAVQVQGFGSDQLLQYGVLLITHLVQNTCKSGMRFNDLDEPVSQDAFSRRIANTLGEMFLRVLEATLHRPPTSTS